MEIYTHDMSIILKKFVRTPNLVWEFLYIITIMNGAIKMINEQSQVLLKIQLVFNADKYMRPSGPK
jgi:hypothetical protein